MRKIFVIAVIFILLCSAGFYFYYNNILKVEFDDGAYIVKEPSNFGQSRSHLIHICEEAEVIGNIYESEVAVTPTAEEGI